MKKLLTAFSIVLFLMIPCCKEPPDRSEQPTRPVQIPRQQAVEPVEPVQVHRPDLIISAIEVFPIQPKAGRRFTLNVYVKNAGNAPSGDYDVDIYILDLYRQQTYPVGTFWMGAMQPNERWSVYSSQDRLVNEPGGYQVHVRIMPRNFDDGNTTNNRRARQFRVID